MITLFKPENLVEKKSRLFTIVVAGVVSILAVPVILPHILHGFHFAHILLHIGGLTLAAFIAILATFAYVKLKTKRLLLSAIAFNTFISAEVILLIETTWPGTYFLGNWSLQEIGHLLTFSTLGLLALGVFRND